MHNHEGSAFKLRSRVILGQPQTPAIVRLLLGKRIVRSERQASVVILLTLFLLVAVSAFLIGRSMYVPSAKISPALSIPINF